MLWGIWSVWWCHPWFAWDSSVPLPIHAYYSFSNEMLLFQRTHGKQLTGPHFLSFPVNRVWSSQTRGHIQVGARRGTLGTEGKNPTSQLLRWVWSWQKGDMEILETNTFKVLWLLPFLKVQNFRNSLTSEVPNCSSLYFPYCYQLPSWLSFPPGELLQYLYSGSYARFPHYGSGFLGCFLLPSYFYALVLKPHSQGVRSLLYTFRF